MIYAPIIIPTLCRYEHFVRLMESLKNNTWAQYTDVYVALDYPPSEKYEEGYNSICKYLESDFSCFANFCVIKRTYNMGSFANCESAIAQVLTKYDRFIRTDDDTEFSPNFLEYMNKCLMEYENDDDVIAVTGYSYPIKWKVSDGSKVLKENFICPMWGTGFWRDKYYEAYDYISVEKGLRRDASHIIKFGAIDKMLDVAKYEFINLCLSPEFENTLAAKMSDVALRMYTATQNKYIIVPAVSKVRNWGFDGTGEYCPNTFNTNEKTITAGNYKYALQTIDAFSVFSLKEDTLADNEGNRKLMNKFDPLSLKAKLKMNGKLALFYLIGEKRFHKLTLLIRRKFK